MTKKEPNNYVSLYYNPSWPIGHRIRMVPVYAYTRHKYRQTQTTTYTQGNTATTATLNTNRIFDVAQHTKQYERGHEQTEQFRHRE